MLWATLFTVAAAAAYLGLDYYLRRKISLFGSAISIVLLVLHYGLGWFDGPVWAVLDIIAGNVLTLSFLSFFGYYMIWMMIGAAKIGFALIVSFDDEPQVSRNGMPDNIARARGVTASGSAKWW